MPDIRSAPAAPPIIFRDDYRPPDWLVPELKLDFDLDPVRTRVKAVMSIIRNGDHDRPLKLDHDDFAALRVTVDGQPVLVGIDGDKLVIPEN